MSYEAWNRLKPGDTTRGVMQHFGVDGESYNIGDYMTHWGQEVHDIGFALHYHRDNTLVPLELQLPSRVLLTPDALGWGHWSVDGAPAGTPVAFFKNGWILGQWSPHDSQWRLALSPFPTAPSVFQLGGVFATPHDTAVFTNSFTPQGSNGSHLTALYFGPAPDVFAEAQGGSIDSHAAVPLRSDGAAFARGATRYGSLPSGYYGTDPHHPAAHPLHESFLENFPDF